MSMKMADRERKQGTATDFQRITLMCNKLVDVIRATEGLPPMQIPWLVARQKEHFSNMQQKAKLVEEKTQALEQMVAWLEQVQQHQTRALAIVPKAVLEKLEDQAQAVEQTVDRLEQRLVKKGETQAPATAPQAVEDDKIHEKMAGAISLAVGAVERLEILEQKGVRVTPVQRGLEQSLALAQLQTQHQHMTTEEQNWKAKHDDLMLRYQEVTRAHDSLTARAQELEGSQKMLQEQVERLTQQIITHQESIQSARAAEWQQRQNCCDEQLGACEQRIAALETKGDSSDMKIERSAEVKPEDYMFFSVDLEDLEKRVKELEKPPWCKRTAALTVDKQVSSTSSAAPAANWAAPGALAARALATTEQSLAPVVDAAKSREIELHEDLLQTKAEVQQLQVPLPSSAPVPDAARNREMELHEALQQVKGEVLQWQEQTQRAHGIAQTLQTQYENTVLELQQSQLAGQQAVKEAEMQSRELLLKQAEVQQCQEQTQRAHAVAQTLQAQYEDTVLELQQSQVAGQQAAQEAEMHRQELLLKQAELEQMNSLKTKVTELECTMQELQQPQLAGPQAVQEAIMHRQELLLKQAEQMQTNTLNAKVMELESLVAEKQQEVDWLSQQLREAQAGKAPPKPEIVEETTLLRSIEDITALSPPKSSGSPTKDAAPPQLLIRAVSSGPLSPKPKQNGIPYSPYRPAAASARSIALPVIAQSTSATSQASAAYTSRSAWQWSSQGVARSRSTPVSKPMSAAAGVPTQTSRMLSYAAMGNGTEISKSYKTPAPYTFATAFPGQYSPHAGSPRAVSPNGLGGSTLYSVAATGAANAREQIVYL